MRVYYIDMHCNSLIVNTLSAILVKKRIPTRHHCLIQYLLKQHVQVINIVTSQGTTLPDRECLMTIKDNEKYRIWEADYVLKKNGLEEVKSVLSPVFSQDDILVMYSHYGKTQYLFGDECIKIVDLTHFYGQESEARCLKSMNVAGYLAEIDLQKYSSIFNKYYSFLCGKHIIRPFQFEDRFKPVKPFEKRKNRVCAMGNIARLYPQYSPHRDFIREYHTRIMQPQRKLFYDHQEELSDILDCYSTIGVDTYDLKKWSNADWFLVREYKWWWNYVVKERFPKYHRAFDMVDVYNEYKIVVNAEDANGFYAIGAIEAMACGCALIGCDYGIYEDLGLEDGKSYIAYDGSLDDFRSKIEFYLQEGNSEKLKKIAQEGYELVVRKYSEEKISKQYYESLLIEGEKRKNE